MSTLCGGLIIEIDRQRYNQSYRHKESAEIALVETGGCFRLRGK